MTDAQVEVKFRALAAEAPPKHSRGKLLENLGGLDKIAGVGDVATRLRRTPHPV